MVFESNDAGVPFVIVHSDLTPDDFDFEDYDQCPKGLHTQRTNLNDPIWQVQVTYFRCGRVILIFEMFHLLSDGETNSILMHKWANMHSKQPYSSPVLDRSLVHASELPAPSPFPL
ncbi:hypothetical protein K7432_006105 [Basidiobolus ranarum]|uniref:Uncharacterized protein n=1 Tax=Basidiobolus ranarum TaxID=34480 RepID=A0ABR2WVJ4_9FUNG